MSPGDSEIILHRLGDQDAKLELIDSAVREIRVEVKKTNGRVNELEVNARIERALSERADKERRELMVHKVNRGEQVSTLVAGLGGCVLTTLLYIVGHAIHLI